MNKMKQKCNHIGLMTGNANMLVKFYIEKLGFRESGARLIPASLMKQLFGLSCECQMTKLVLGEIVLEIFNPAGIDISLRTEDTSGLNHWGLYVSDKESFCQDLASKGVEIIKAPNKDRYIYFIKDPEGNRIEVFD